MRNLLGTGTWTSEQVLWIAIFPTMWEGGNEPRQEETVCNGAEGGWMDLHSMLAQ